MQKIVIVCDCCGFEVNRSVGNFVAEIIKDGSVVDRIHHFQDICPECVKIINFTVAHAITVARKTNNKDEDAAVEVLDGLMQKLLSIKHLNTKGQAQDDIFLNADTYIKALGLVLEILKK